MEIKGKTGKRYELKKCPECGKLVQGGQGLWGHLCLAHGIKRLTKVTRLEKELVELQLSMGWKEQAWSNQKLKFEQEIARLQKLNAIEEYMAGEQQRAEERWTQAKCLYCGKSVGEHIEVRDYDTKRKAFMCPE